MRRLMLVVAAAALFGCGGPSKEQYGAAQAEAAKFKQTAADEAAKSQALEQKVQGLEQQNATLQGQTAELQKKLGETAAQQESTAAKLAATAGEYEANTMVKLNDKLLFKENSSKLTPEATRTLDAVAQALGAQKDKSILVAGFTDDAEGGKTAYAKRWQLSAARAQEVAKYLAGRGIDPKIIGVAGLADTRTVAPNDTLANKAQNRRVEIALTPKAMKTNTMEVAPAELKAK